MVCGVLVSQPGIEPESPALEGRFPTSGPPPCIERFFYLRLHTWSVLMQGQENSAPNLQRVQPEILSEISVSGILIETRVMNEAEKRRSHQK